VRGVRRRLSSPRFRRRATIASVVLGLGGAAAVIAMAVGNTGQHLSTPIDRSKPAWVYHPPPTMKLTQADRVDIFQTSAAFVDTAVRRRHLDVAWKLLAPEMKKGETRAQWDSGFNNVVPFKAVGIAAWRVLYAYQNDVALNLAVLGAPTAEWAGKTFTIELKRNTASKRWLVASWSPDGIGGRRQVRSLAKLPPPVPDQSRLSSTWLLVPLGFVLGLALLPLPLTLATFIRTRRSARRYAAALAFDRPKPRA
jgi:hypothetical protein